MPARMPGKGIKQTYHTGRYVWVDHIGKDTCVGNSGVRVRVRASRSGTLGALQAWGWGGRPTPCVVMICKDDGTCASGTSKYTPSHALSGPLGCICCATPSSVRSDAAHRATRGAAQQQPLAPRVAARTCAWCELYNYTRGTGVIRRVPSASRVNDNRCSCSFPMAKTVVRGAMQKSLHMPHRLLLLPAWTS